MLTPKKMIPSLAVAMLPLTGCGGDGGGSSTGGTLDDALQAFCMKLVDCFPRYYTMQGCLNYYDSVFPDNISSNCEAALVSYFNCGTALSCSELDTYSNSCDDEFNNAYDICISEIE